MSPGDQRLSGTLTVWNDERGFGFISHAQGGERTFVHIKAFAPRATRPQVGEVLTFDVESADGKRRAARVLAAGQRMPSAPHGSAARSRSGRGQSRSRPGAASYLAIVGFVIVYLTINAVWPIAPWSAGLYLAASLVCFLVYAIDKSAATAGRWRVAESTLLLLGVVGGWPGAIIAQQTLRHKTKKASFRCAFWATVIINVIVFVLLSTPALAVASARL
jgi:uncharacterized membrane protein YsdA (DUF1294 family)/cold shock CspA family protein